jgi:hypothetical protein
MSVLKDFGQFCSTPNQPHLRVYAEREIEDYGAFGVFWYRRPTGYTRTGARHRGETTWIVEWSYVRRSPDGSAWRMGEAVSGFPSRDAAVSAAAK